MLYALQIQVQDIPFNWAPDKSATAQSISSVSQPRQWFSSSDVHLMLCTQEVQRSCTQSIIHSDSEPDSDGPMKEHRESVSLCIMHVSLCM